MRMREGESTGEVREESRKQKAESRKQWSGLQVIRAMKR
jgi:hypothetical protein